MDRVGADFEMSVDSIHKKLGANAWPVLLPLGREDQLRGQLDVINKKAVIYSDSDQLGSTYEVTDIPQEHVAAVDKAYKELVEQISNIDDEIAEVVLEEKPDRKSTRLNSSHLVISYAVFCLKKKKNEQLRFRCDLYTHHPIHAKLVPLYHR